MDKHGLAILELQLQNTIKHLQERGFDTLVCESRNDVLPLLDTLIQDGERVAHGGSMTLQELQAIPYLKKRHITYLDRDKEGLTPDEKQTLMHQALDCDTYLLSTSAITEDGQLYNIDGNGNRLAALIYGPKQVLIIVGLNKLVSDMEMARNRMRTMSAPANAHRLGCATPCVKTGTCIDCRSKDRICAQELITSWQRTPHRIKIIFVKDTLGY